MSEDMIGAFAAVENSPLSIWVREDLYAYFYLLVGHALGMAMLVGGGVAVCLRMLGVARAAPMEKFRAFFPVMWIGLAFAVVSGALLLLGYPAKALTNPVFPLKLACFIGAGLLTRTMARQVFPVVAQGAAEPAWTRPVAGAALALWALGVAGGKLLLYTHSHLLVS